MFSRQLPYFDELDHRHLVDECRGVFDARGVLWRGLVQTAREAGVDVMNAIIQTERKSHVVIVDDHPLLCDGQIGRASCRERV